MIDRQTETGRSCECGENQGNENYEATIQNAD